MAIKYPTRPQYKIYGDIPVKIGDIVITSSTYENPNLNTHYIVTDLNTSERGHDNITVRAMSTRRMNKWGIYKANPMSTFRRVLNDKEKEEAIAMFAGSGYEGQNYEALV